MSFHKTHNSLNRKYKNYLEAPHIFYRNFDTDDLLLSHVLISYVLVTVSCFQNNIHKFHKIVCCWTCPLSDVRPSYELFVSGRSPPYDKETPTLHEEPLPLDDDEQPEPEPGLEPELEPEPDLELELDLDLDLVVHPVWCPGPPSEQ